MTILEFETSLDDGVIRLPDAIAAQLEAGAAVRVVIEPLGESQGDPLTSDQAWDAFLASVHERHSRGESHSPYQWNRDDAYDHLRGLDDSKGSD